MPTEHSYLRVLRGPGSEIPNPAAVDGLVIRPPQRDEAATLHEIYLDAFSTRTADPLDAATWIAKWPLHRLCVLEHSVLALDGETAVGYLLTYAEDEFPGEAFIGQLGVRTGSRRRGVASAMLWSALRLYRSLGLASATLQVAPDNESAIRLYEKLGFVRHEAGEP